MIEGQKRREIILEELSKATKNVNATQLAEKFGVSRQIVVGDIALLRASGIDIVSNSRGYRLNKKSTGLLETKLAVKHRPDQVEEELRLIVENGGTVVDVIIEHELYGEIKGTVDIKNDDEVTAFLNKVEQAHATLLSSLTDGIHLHTIQYPDEETLVKIKQALSQAGILLEENE
ncbi:transcription repressor NadR [Enterococcus cecorum]|uniref:transcription repressor NadR n=1 Tax=Enterococcus cecorum TaxID=44008 RepID=UPI000643811D|nr:transcription repressor NadR [Enterococcus cecorum]KLO73287.1 DNA-binding protein [Enterococcus cecorum]CAI3436413.1 transcription repressor NadR [Enterococcus cecorum]